MVDAETQEECPECHERVVLTPELDSDHKMDLNRQHMPYRRKVWFITWHPTGPGSACGTDYASKREAERAFAKAGG